MKILERQYIENWTPSSYSIKDIHQHIEHCARVCYKSEIQIEDVSVDRIIKTLISNKQIAMLEHGTMYLIIPEKKLSTVNIQNIIDGTQMIKPGKMVINNSNAYITTNYRAYVEYPDHHLLNEYIVSEPAQFHKRRTTIYCDTNIQVATELICHRTMSFTMELMKYCADDKEKSENDITFVLPCWIYDIEDDSEYTKRQKYIEWINAMQDAENHYMRMRAMKIPAEHCAQVLPKATKASLMITGYDDDWDRIFDIHYFEKTGPVHPQMKELMTLIYDEVKS